MAAIGSIVLKNSPLCRISMGPGLERAGAARRSRDYWRRHWDDLGEFAEVLGGGGEEELVFCPAWSA
jgi:hypothetical protein